MMMVKSESQVHRKIKLKAWVRYIISYYDKLTAHLELFLVNYSISNTIVLEIP